MRPLVLAFLVLIGACTSTDAIGSDTTLVLPGEGTTTSTSSTTTTLVVTATTTSTNDEPATTLDKLAADALVTPTGVVVAVLEQTASGYMVRTPCGDEALVATGTPVGGVRVVIDPGHGGEIDTGAVGPNGLAEKHLNLVLSRALQGELLDRGVAAILSRTGDYPSRLEVRSALADHLDADLLLSIHHNAPTPGPSDTPGTEMFVRHDSDDSRRLGGLVWSHVVEALSGFDVQWSAAPDAGVLSVLNTRGNDAYGMVRSPETVSVLAELGYLSHQPEAELFATHEYVEVASTALADAIEAYLTTEDPGAGFVSEPRVFNPQPGIGSDVCVDPDLESRHSGPPPLLPMRSVRIYRAFGTNLT
jgi:N-acetylmuramoyl-L-alanine amidase